MQSKTFILERSSRSRPGQLDSSHCEDINNWHVSHGGPISDLHPLVHDSLKSSPETLLQNSVQVHQCGLFFKGQDSAYPSNLRLPESSHTWSTEGSQPGNEMHSAPVRGKAIYHRRLRINTTPPEPNEQLHIVCQQCNLHLQVLQNLLKSDTGYQKLRCGACWKISCFQLYPSHSSPEHSPAGSKNMSPLMSCQFSPDVSDGLSGSWRDPGTKLVN
jgi:hypothetical protein